MDMKIETVDEFLKRGGKITRVEDVLFLEGGQVSGRKAAPKGYVPFDYSEMTIDDLITSTIIPKWEFL
jgi:hypothetical protein